MARRKRRNKIAKIKAQEPVSKEEERKAFPKSLIKSFIEISNDGWNDENLYQDYLDQAHKYLGKKRKDKVESGKLIVLLSRATSDLRDVKKQKTKKEKA